MSPTKKPTSGVPAPADFIPLIVPEIHGNEWKYVKECLDTNWVSSVGSYVDAFEKMAAEQADTKYAVATVNGTAALPPNDGSGMVTRSGRSRKLLCACSPPIRTGRVQARPPLMASPAP